MTAARMIQGLSQSKQAIDLMYMGENESAVKLLRKSFENCDKALFYDPDKICSSLQRNRPDRRFARPSLRARIAQRTDWRWTGLGGRANPS